MFHRFGYLCVVTVFLFSFAAAASAADSARDDLAFLDGLTLIDVDTDDVSSLHVARRMVQAYGGTVAIMSPPSLLIGWVPFEAREALIGKAGIREIYYTEVFPGEIESSDPRTAAMVTFYNSAVRGDLAREFEESARAAAADPAPVERESDVFTPEPIEEEAYLENLRSAGLDTDLLSRQGILPDPASPATMGNSDYMTGTVALTIFFVESDGSGSDPDTYTWSASSMQTYLNNVATALAWWSTQAGNHGDCWVTFLINYYSGADPRCQQWVEPILHDDSYEDIWVNEIMANFGYTSGGRITRVTSFNTWQRSYYQTNRAYSAFVPYNPPPAPSFFPGSGHTAYAYWYGPYTVLLFRVQGWTTAQVFAHESGHIFGACDEYTGGCGSYSCGSICTNGTLNGNCEACNPDSRECMMKANSFSLCGYTIRHVGWEVNTPCAPAEPSPLPSPTLAAATPDHGGHGTRLDITVTGTNFYPGIKLDLGSDIFVHVINLSGGNTINAQIEILGSAPPGPRNVRVTNPDGQYRILSDAFEVRPTTRHYYSPAGGNQPPYVSPAAAATTLADAIKATYDGDTLFVVTTQFDDFALYVDRGVLLHGGWDPTFTQRNLATGKTVFSLGSNVTFQTSGGGAGLDGFILYGGTGAGDIVPFNAVFGGAIRFVGGAGIVSNCEIHSCSAGGAEAYGVGGAVFANDCAVDIRDNVIHGNSATQGGAIYLWGCTGSVSNNAIYGNAVYTPAQPAVGAGVALVGSSNVTLSDNTVSANAPAAEGGALYIENCTGIVVSGGLMQDNETTFSGGAIAVKASTAAIGGTELRGNSAGSIGGALFTANASEVTIAGVTFFENSAQIGGAVFASSGSVFLRHSLFARNSATMTAGALTITGVAAGEIAGNTLYGNSSPAVGGMLLSFPGEVYDNIITGSAGTGLSVSGGAPALLAYNLVWDNSGGDYVGCTPGIGSVSTDPFFIDAANDDYHVGLNSPVIDGGRPGDAYEDPDGSRGDIGAYGWLHAVMDQPSYPKNLTAERAGDEVVLEWNANPETDIAEYAVYGELTADFVPGPANLITMVAGTDSSVALELPADSLYYRISAVDTSGYAGGFSDAVLYSPTTTSLPGPQSYVFALRQNVPNPFNPSTLIAYELPARTAVELTIYDVDGRLVRRLVDEAQGPGTFTVTWEGRNDHGGTVASGVYFYRLSTSSGVKTKKMVFLK